MLLRSLAAAAVLAAWLLASGGDALRVVVVGANGRTGRKVVDVSLRKGYETVAVTRSGELAQPSYSTASLLTTLAGDVGNPASLQLSAADAVVFCASASKEGGTPQQVDRDGAIAVGKACIAAGVPRYVIVSSGAVSKPWSPVYLFLNLFGGIMKAKIEGEDAVRALYKQQPNAALGYTIVRPGGLTEEEPLGVAGLELNQKDEKSGRISRWDVASICIECITEPAASRVTLEAYNKDTGKPLAEVGLSNLFKLKTAGEAGGGGGGAFERRGATWKDIFAGLLTACGGGVGEWSVLFVQQV